MVEWILTALALFGVSRADTAAVAPSDTSNATTQSPTTAPSQTTDPATTDGKQYPPTG
jgi:hypothetical protein